MPAIFYMPLANATSNEHSITRLQQEACEGLEVLLLSALNSIIHHYYIDQRCSLAKKRLVLHSCPVSPEKFGFTSMIRPIIEHTIYTLLRMIKSANIGCYVAK